MAEGRRIKTKRKSEIEKKEKELKEKEEKLKQKANEIKKTTMEAKRVAAQLQLMAEQLDRLANHVLSEVKKWRMDNFRHSSFISDIQVKINVLQNYLSWFN